MSPVVDIVIRSYYKDVEWLGYCLRSIRTYARGFRSVIVAVPRASVGAFKRHRLDFDRLVICDDFRDDYLGQQVTKLHADEVTDADFITHIDSDAIFVKLTTPDDLMDGIAPRVLMTPYSKHPRNGPWRIPWQGVTERFLRTPVSYNFMQSMPLTYPRWLYPALREFALDTHGCSLRTYVLSQRARCFSEFNALGAFAYRFHRESMSWVDSCGAEHPPPRTHVFWSWGGVTDEARSQLEALLSGGVP